MHIRTTTIKKKKMHKICITIIKAEQWVVNRHLFYSNFTVPPSKTPWLFLGHLVGLPAGLGFYMWNILTLSLGVLILPSHHQREQPENDKQKQYTEDTWNCCKPPDM